jgi:ABC-type multidrug transport system ATPase subunit
MMPRAPAKPAATTGAGLDGVAVAITGLTVQYGSTVVIEGIDLSVKPGTGVCFVGENGAGKSTLLRCIAGLQAPSAGNVLVFGREPGRSVEFWRDVATTAESPSWYSGLTVREHLELVCIANGVDPQDGRVDRVAANLGLGGLADSLPSTLSTGQRQRLLLCATLVRPSRLLLLDEPEQRLDAAIRQTVAGSLLAYLETGGTIVMASHDQELISSAGCRPVPMVRPAPAA